MPTLIARTAPTANGAQLPPGQRFPWARPRTCATAIQFSCGDGKEAGNGWQVRAEKGSSGKFHFNLLAANGQVIATSEAYEHKQAALNRIESVKKNAPGAEVEDQTAS